MPEAAGGHGLAVEDGQRDGAGVQVLDDDRLGGDLDVLELGQVRVRAPAQRQDHLLTRVDVVAVDQHLEGGLGVTHGRDATGRSPTDLAGLDQVEPPVLAGGLLDRRPHPLGEQHGEEDQPDQVAGAPEDPASQLLVGGRVGQPGAHRTVVQRGVPGTADQRLLSHDRDAEEGVERQGQHGQQHPERVADAVGQRVDADQGPEEERAHQHQVDVHQLVHVGRLERGVVPAGEVERPRRDDVQEERQGWERQHLGHPGVHHGEQPPPRSGRERAQRQGDRRAQRQRQRHDHRQHHVLDHVHAQQRGVVGRQTRTRWRRRTTPCRPPRTRTSAPSASGHPGGEGLSTPSR